MLTNVDKYFTYSHLPEQLQNISKPIAELAELMNKKLPEGSEKKRGHEKTFES